MLLVAGTTDNTTAAAIDFFMDYTGVNAGTLSFDWAVVFNSTGNRCSSLRVYYSTDGSTFTELTSAQVLNKANNVAASGSITTIALPSAFNNSSTARLRFYIHNGSGGSTGSRPKFSIDNVTVTATSSASAPTVTSSAATSIGATTATLNGNVTSDGGATITDRGFCYKTSSGVTISDNKTAVSGTTGSYTLSPTLSVNTHNYFAAYAINSAGTTLSSPELDFWTLANVPGAPTVNNPTATSLDVAVNENSNPSSTEFAIKVTYGATTKYVQSNGTLGDSEAWATDSTWGTKTVTGLSSGTEYMFSVAARNGANTATAYGSTASGTTSSSGSPAAITTQPDAMYSGCAGSSVNLTVTASGSPVYAWRKRGTGWASNWSLTTSGNGNVFTNSSSIDVGGSSWGMWADNGFTTEAKRDFAAVATGHMFYVEMDNAGVGTGSSVGFGLQNSSGTTAFEFYFQGGDSYYTYNDSTGEHNTTCGWTESGLLITVSNVTTTTYSLTFTVKGGATYGPYTGTYAGSVSSISRFRAFYYEASGQSGGNLFFNSLKVGKTPAAALYDDNAGYYSSWSGDYGQKPLSNGGDISGATSDTLTISNLEAADAGTYDVVVYNSYGGETSSSANGVLTVYALPTITLGSSPTVYRGTTSASLTYSGTSGNPNQYSIDFDAAAESAGFADVSWSALGGSPISLTVPAAAAAATYNARSTSGIRRRTAQARATPSR